MIFLFLFLFLFFPFLFSSGVFAPVNAPVWVGHLTMWGVALL